MGRFPSQKEYEAFGAALERFIFFLLRDQYKMMEHLIGSNDEEDATQNDDVDTAKDENADHEVDENDGDQSQNADSKPKSGRTAKRKARANDEMVAKSRIYLSPNYGSKQTLLLLIPGSGAVRAGQWARSICINDNLAAGCMYPYIAEAFHRDWG